MGSIQTLTLSILLLYINKIQQDIFTWLNPMFRSVVMQIITRMYVIRVYALLPMLSNN